ncbi:hypothetical protein CALCODRAFT_498285 [Calocera cornea HHB12733]|uniref:Uncharacterized protein n=1 Tax=Calocera cornea HHB12733 TaxID=1353952 RepID=A0A165EWR2_9BASI|nr:hypothetical protein CALCODRAFT_498285 [Calocera cornea HHB12733]
MFARQLANTSRRALTQRTSFAARRSYHLPSEPRAWGFMSDIPMNGVYLGTVAAVVTAVGITSGVKTWLFEPQELAPADHSHKILRH